MAHVLIKVGDLEIEVKRSAAGKILVTVHARPYGNATIATDDEVRSLVQSLTKLVDERKTA